MEKQHPPTPKVPTTTPSLNTQGSPLQQLNTLPPKAGAWPAEPALPTLPPARMPCWVHALGKATSTLLMWGSYPGRQAVGAVGVSPILGVFGGQKCLQGGLASPDYCSLLAGLL